MLLRAVVVLATHLGWALPAFAEEQSQRAALADHYIDERKKNPSLFQGTPVSHVVPSFNTISYALAGGSIDTTVEPENQNPTYPSKLHLTGYEVAPYLSLSLRRIGLGFSVESGHKEAEFTNSYLTSTETRIGEVDYRGVGVFLYWIPTGKLAKLITPTLIFGGRNYTAKHSHRGQYGTSGGPTSSISYSVPNYEAGINLDVALAKALHVIPWGNYSYMDTASASSAASKLYSGEADFLNTDIELFWHDRPDLSYGIDFAARFGAVQVRLGGLLGMVATAGQGSDRITDKSVRLAFSIEQKGR